MGIYLDAHPVTAAKIMRPEKPHTTTTCSALKAADFKVAKTGPLSMQCGKDEQLHWYTLHVKYIEALRPEVHSLLAAHEVLRKTLNTTELGDEHHFIADPQGKILAGLAKPTPDLEPLRAAIKALTETAEVATGKAITAAKDAARSTVHDDVVSQMNSAMGRKNHGRP